MFFFRWKQLEECGRIVYRGVFNNKVWTLAKENDTLEYKVLDSEKSTPRDSQTRVDYQEILSNYLRLEENLVKLYDDWSERDPSFKESATKFFGIRVLRQDPVENIFSFICSTNNNITR